MSKPLTDDEMVMLIRSVRADEREACATMADVEAMRHEEALREFSGDRYDDEHTMHLSAAMDMRSLADAIRARRP